MQFSHSGLMPSVLKPKVANSGQKLVPAKKRHRKKSKDAAIGCTGVSINLRERLEPPHQLNFNPYGGAAGHTHDAGPGSATCSLRCRHPISIGTAGIRLRRPPDHAARRSAARAVDPDKWVSDLIYKRYTETDSRPVSPVDVKSGKSQASSKHSHGDGNGHGGRRCRTPEPETKQCKFHQRRTLVLDLRRVKSVDLLPGTRTRSRQGSTATDGDGDSVSTLLGGATGTSSSVGADSEPANWYDDDYGYGADEEDSEVVSKSQASESKQAAAHMAAAAVSKTGSRVVELQPRPRAPTRRNSTRLNLNLGLKNKGANGNNRKLTRKELRSSSPITYERPTSPKLLEGEKCQKVGKPLDTRAEESSYRIRANFQEIINQAAKTTLHLRIRARLGLIRLVLAFLVTLPRRFPAKMNNLKPPQPRRVKLDYKSVINDTSPSSVNLPFDFVDFIRSNYDKIAEIEEKIREFHRRQRSKENRTGPGRRKLGWSSRTFSSGGTSTSSDHDVVNVISATVTPKADLLDEFDAIHIDSEYLQQLKERAGGRSFDEKELAGLREIMRRFPMVFISDSNSAAQSGDPERGKSRLAKRVMIIEGSAVKLAERQFTGPSPPQKLDVDRKRRRLQAQKAVNGQGSSSASAKRKGGNKSKNKSDKKSKTALTINDLALDIYNRFFAPGSGQQLTLPPLHSSVLTLLGQRAPHSQGGGLGFGLKSPRSGSFRDGAVGLHSAGGGVRKGQKLRRHNHKLKKPATNQEEIKTDHAAPTQNRSTEGPNLEKKPSIEEALPQQTLEDENEEQDQKIQNQHSNTHDRPTRSLQEVLDGYLKHNSWILDSAQVEREIEEIKASMRKNESALDSGNISLREDVWLSFPKAWSSSSCTFLAPTDVHELKSLSPLEYLRKYVHISQRRKHLYGLVFERYRTMENPLGRHISAQAGLKAVAEVLGEPLTPIDARDLLENLLDIQSPELQLDQETFGGICAACERIYGKYPVEESAEFARRGTRLRSNNNGKESKDVNQPGHLESADFEYLSAKVMGNDVEEHLAQLLNAICRRWKPSGAAIGEAA